MYIVNHKGLEMMGEINNILTIEARPLPSPQHLALSLCSKQLDYV